MQPSEHEEQVAVINWARMQAGKWPELEWLYAIANGIPLSGSIKERSRLVNYMKSEGAFCVGISDLHLPCARGGYFGLWIEMKKRGGAIREGQAEFLKYASEQGYFDAVCYSADEAIEILETYLNWPRTRVFSPNGETVVNNEN